MGCVRWVWVWAGNTAITSVNKGKKSEKRSVWGGGHLRMKGRWKAEAQRGSTQAAVML